MSIEPLRSDELRSDAEPNPPASRRKPPLARTALLLATAFILANRRRAAEPEMNGASPRNNIGMMNQPGATVSSTSKDSGTSSGGQPKPAHDTAVERALGNAALLLSHASETGLELKPELVANIESAHEAYGQGKWTADTARSFWPTYSQLCALVKPVTAESLVESKGEGLHNVLRRHRLLAIILTAIILPLSITLFVNTSISNDINERIKDNDALIATMRTRLAEISGDALKDLPREILSQGQQIRAGVVFLRQRTDILNWFVLYVIPEPLTTLTAATRPDVLQEVYDTINGYQTVREHAKSVQQANLMAYGALTVYVLPVLYALLGACAYALRSLSEQTALRTYRQSYATFARLIIALIVGLVVGLFNNFSQGASLSPLAIAFLAGYAVEVFFSFLDAFLETLRKVRSVPQASAAP